MRAFEAPQIRIASAAEQDRVRAAYEALGYWKEIKLDSADTVWLAEYAGEIVGIVRVAAEHGTLVLRGMRVLQSFQRQRIGTRLLQSIAASLGERECYCIPYSHLIGFYRQVGFVEIEPGADPSVEPSVAAFLSARLAEYRRNGLDVTVMRRPLAK